MDWLTGRVATSPNHFIVFLFERNPGAILSKDLTSWCLNKPQFTCCTPHVSIWIWRLNFILLLQDKNVSVIISTCEKQICQLEVHLESADLSSISDPQLKQSHMSTYIYRSIRNVPYVFFMKVNLIFVEKIMSMISTEMCLTKTSFNHHFRASALH